MPANPKGFWTAIVDSFDYLDSKNWNRHQTTLDRSRILGTMADAWAMRSDWSRYAQYFWMGFSNYVREQDPKLFADISAGQYNAASKPFLSASGD